jgi:hypothetical protein
VQAGLGGSRRSLFFLALFLTKQSSSEIIV